MRNTSPARGARAGAAICGFLFSVAALTAGANYDSTSLDGNLQSQCKDFTASVVEDTSFTVSAECNKDGSSTLNSAEFDLSGHVRWDIHQHSLSWDATLSTSVVDIAANCKPNGASPFTTSATDVTLALTCAMREPTGAPGTANASLALNGNLKVGSDGSLSRR